MKKYLNIILFLVLSIESQPLLARINPIKLYKAVSPQEKKAITKLIKKTPLHCLRLTDDSCRFTKSLYVGLKPKGGPFSGRDTEMVIMDGKLFGRFRLSDRFPFSWWLHINDHQRTKKQQKRNGFFVCPDGSIQLPNETDK